jgi:anti-sigma regulatory factor (Ser/Thr protein kinase)
MRPIGPAPPFLHEAFFYVDEDEYLAGTVPFIEDGLAAGEQVLVAVPMRQLHLLRPHFAGPGTTRLQFAAMEEMGRNPARIIPAWAAFVKAHAAEGRPARGIGEPIWSGRSDDELVECERHEALLNLAFADAAGFSLLCPYDTGSLDDRIIDEAQRNHPQLGRPGNRRASDHYNAEIPPWLETPLPPVPGWAELLTFGVGPLAPVRRRTAALAVAAGITESRLDDLVVAVSEAITNSVFHGGGSGQIALWNEDNSFRCEIRDRGRIADPLAGRVKPSALSPTGRGLWLVNQICDLVQVRAVPGGQVIRLHFRL